MKRGFTLIEMMIASAISVIILTALVSMFIAIARISKSASDEFQAALIARSLRERLFYQLLPPDANAPNGYGGLLSARNVSVSSYGFNADLRFTTSDGNLAFLLDQSQPSAITLERSSDAKIPSKAKGAAFLKINGTNELVYVYLVVEKGGKEKFKYKDRVVVPLAGVTQSMPPSTSYGPLDVKSSSYFQYSF